MLPSMVSALNVGDNAPLFNAESTAGTISLESYRGQKHVVLAIYYADFTPVWTGEMQAFQMDLEKFKKLDAQVIGISSDSLETHEKFSEKYGLTFPLISDSDGVIKNLYGRDRITYLIDRKGIIRFIQKGVPENKDFLSKLKDIDSGTE